MILYLLLPQVINQFFLVLAWDFGIGLTSAAISKSGFGSFYVLAISIFAALGGEITCWTASVGFDVFPSTSIGNLEPTSIADDLLA